MIHQNLLINPATRYHTGFAFPPEVGTRLQNVQIEHRTTSGNALVSNSLFVSYGTTSRLDHICTTFWNYDTIETFYSTQTINRLFDGNPEIATRREFHLPAVDGGYLDTNEEFLRDILRSSPILFKAVFRGESIGSLSFGRTTPQDTSIPADWFIPSEKIPKYAIQTLMKTPLGSCNTTMSGDVPDWYNSEFFGEQRGSSHWETLAKESVGIMWGLVGLGTNALFSINDPSMFERSLKKSVVLTTDRFFMVSLADAPPQWLGVDLLTLPLYHIQNEFGLTPKRNPFA